MIHGSKGQYRVGKDGSIWSCRGKGRVKRWRRLHPSPNRTGHARVNLYVNGVITTRLIHQLVLEAFIGPCPSGMECCHFPDRNPANNNLDNIRWGTRLDNIQDAIKHGTNTAGERHGRSKLTNKEAEEMRRLYSLGGWTMQQLADKYNICLSSAFNIIRRNSYR